MARVLILCCLLVVVALAADAAPQDRLENINVDEVLSNRRLLRTYVQCILDDGDGRCTKEGKELKKALPRMVETGCNDCSPKQVENGVKVIKHMTENYPEEWAQMKAKYDPTGEFSKKHADTWKQRGVTF
ncbi:ejaculatory bulb-specific protein 3-like [Schistocerca piceifrons]|uniref:ejaculatory bulb-specific protein 3-like n=1 Tax=Schistocerca piceifrons TaxID=274613 RepID=UPI001F5F4985|nr:ejaculatory bulb-specific protein 3-like [Schistocerca piceifrons]